MTTSSPTAGPDAAGCPACGALVLDMDTHISWHGGGIESGMCGSHSGMAESGDCALVRDHLGQHRDAAGKTRWGRDR